MKHALILLAFAAASAGAQTAQPAFLPPAGQITEAVEATPEMAEARAVLARAQAEGQVLRRGEHDTSLTTSYDRRKIASDGGFDEWSTQVSRGVRLPAKADADRKSADLGVSIGENMLEDTRHKLSLIFVQMWTEWLEAGALAAIDAREAETYEREVKALERRYQLKDVALIDVQQARSALARARTAAALSAGRLSMARAALDRRFPGLVDQDAPVLTPPVLPDRSPEQWPEIIIARSHELSIARDLAQKARWQARRAQYDRVPDPVVGARIFSERGGTETGAGVFVTLPFPGGRRQSLASQQAAEARAAEARLAQASRDLDMTARRDVLNAVATQDAWRNAHDALAMAEASARGLKVGYDLGETSLSEMLTAQRQSFDAARLEVSSRKAAHLAVLTLRLDAHELWLSEE